MKQKKSLGLKILVGIIVLLLVMVAAFFVYVSSYYKACSLALKDLKSDAQVKVEKNEDIVFTPVKNTKNAGFIFYPGAKVENSAYSPMAKEIAAKGYTVVIAKMRFNLAIFSQNRADSIIAKNNNIKKWVIGGHSLGGVMAANYALEHKNIKGLVFLASYPMSNKDLTGRSIKVLSLYGSNDKVAHLKKVKAAKKQLPADTEFLEIKGGNHGGFGDYGHQRGDGKAAISNKEQMSYAAEHIVKLLDSLN